MRDFSSGNDARKSLDNIFNEGWIYSHLIPPSTLVYLKGPKQLQYNLETNERKIIEKPSSD